MTGTSNQVSRQVKRRGRSWSRTRVCLYPAIHGQRLVKAIGETDWVPPLEIPAVLALRPQAGNPLQ